MTDQELLKMPHGAGPCVLCGHDPACGVSAVGPDQYTCHTDDHSCYHRWTVYGARPDTSLKSSEGSTDG